MPLDRRLPTALITGASRGIGRELARVFAENHYQLILVARDQARLEALAEELHARHLVPVRIEICDLGDPAARAAMVARLRAENVVVDVLVNNAGFGVEGPFVETDGAREQAMIDLNVSALVGLTKDFLPQMVNRRSGRVLNIASIAAFQPGPYFSIYFATKAFVLSFSEAIATELRGTGVTVTAYCPGPTRTDFEKNLAADSKLFLPGMPVADPRDVALGAFASVLRGRRTALHGARIFFFAVLSKLSPRGFVLLCLGRLLRANVRSGARQVENVAAP